MNLLGCSSGWRALGRATATTCLAVLFLVGAPLAAPLAGASTVPPTGLRMVQVTFHREPPAPREAASTFLRTPGSLAAFSGSLRADHIGVHLPPTSPGGCRGGNQYTAELTYSSGHKVFLYAYECGGAVTGNLTGNVKAFVKYLSTLVR